MQRRVERAEVAASAHRGLDNQGSFVDETFALGHTRLAIIESPASPQPTRSPGSRKVIVYNGESYNFGELQHDASRGHSDTEARLESNPRQEPERALVGLRVGKMTEASEARLGVETGDNGDT
ncbi:hypothetical protein IY145_24140 [Methylosinus sp. H3A]|uniref:hypothetical protein n=1 Tax=Methylosinus sp. H3A TaxID=2785786 RepID=UPI0018C332D1|nr:hypothetical protein [Methylosinus sp. H3A]MBG0812430.1 hypothetical protein [Methylosinus sp. H3A]